MMYPIGVRSVGLAILAVAVAGCASPYAYYGDSGRGPCSISGRHTDCEGGTTGDCAGEPCDEPCDAAGPCRLRDLVACHAGCGRMYWGEWAYDPPDECDPCNDHGDWTGPQCCPPRGWLNLLSGLHGCRFHSTCESPTCPDCGAATDAGCGTEVFSGDSAGEVWIDDPTGSSESIVPSSSPDDVPPDSVLREAHKPTPQRHPASRLVRRGRTPVVH